MKGDYPYHAYIRVRLPKFVITFLRTMVRKANETRKGEDRWSVSALLESWLLEAVAKEGATDLNKTARQSPQFKREAEAWLRWVVKR